MSAATSFQPVGVSSRPRKRPDAKASATKEATKIKVSIVLDVEVDRKLSLLAAKYDCDRSCLVNQVLFDLTQGVVLSFRGESEKTTESIAHAAKAAKESARRQAARSTDSSPAATEDRQDAAA